MTLNDNQKGGESDWDSDWEEYSYMSQSSNFKFNLVGELKFGNVDAGVRE